MRYIQYELIRIFGQRKCFLWFLILLLVNIGTLWLYFDKGSIDSTEYRQTKQDLMDNPSNIELLYEDDMDSATNEELLREYESCQTYPEYIQKVMDEADQSQTISIFKTRFSVNNMKKTKKDYEKLLKLQVPFVGGYGMETGLSFLGSVVVELLFIMVLLNELVMHDRKNGLLSLYRTTMRGDGRLVIAKYIAAVCYSTVFVTCVTIENLLLAQFMYGRVELSAPVQSLLTYVDYGYCINLGEFIGIYILYRVLCFCFMIAILLLLAFVSINEIVFSTMIITVGLVEYGILKVSSYVGIHMLERLNLFRIMLPKNFFAYYNYNFFNQPVSAMPVDVCISIISIGVLLVLTGLAYVMKDREYVQIQIKSRLVRGDSRSHFRSLWSLEGKKLWIGYKAVIVIIGLIVMQVYSYNNKQIYWSDSEVYYKYYMEYLQGDITQDKIEYIESELERMKNLHEKLERVKNAYKAGKMSEKKWEEQEKEIYHELKAEEPLLRCQKYMDYVMNLHIKNKGLVYDRGWNELAGGQLYNNDMRNAIMVVFAVLMITLFLYVEDYRYHMNDMLSITWKENQLNRQKAGRLFIAIMLCGMLVYLPQLVWLEHQYGLNAYQYGVQCIPLLESVTLPVSIGVYFILVYAIRIIALCIIAGIVIWIGKIIKTTNTCMLISIVLFIIPLVLHLLKVDGLDYLSFNSLLSGNMLLRS